MGRLTRLSGFSALTDSVRTADAVLFGYAPARTAFGGSSKCVANHETAGHEDGDQNGDHPHGLIPEEQFVDQVGRAADHGHVENRPENVRLALALSDRASEVAGGTLEPDDAFGMTAAAVVGAAFKRRRSGCRSRAQRRRQTHLLHD